MLMDDECLFFYLAWAPHSVSPQSSSKIFFKRFLEILLQQSDELRKLGEFELLNTPLTSRINTIQDQHVKNMLCVFHLILGDVSFSSPKAIRSDVGIHCALAIFFHLWGEDACASLDNFCKSPVNDEDQPEWRDKAPTLRTEPCALRPVLTP